MPSAASTADKPQVTSHTERVRQALEQEIVSGQRAPGEPILEAQLMAQHGVSRTPVREAVLLLASQGLVHVAPRAGIRVHKPSASELVALLECLAELEAVSARLAAQRVDAAARQVLERLHALARAAARRDDLPAYDAANSALHALLHAASGNAVLVEQIEAVRKRLSAFRRRVLQTPGRLLAASKEHEAIVAAVLAGRADEAQAAMREHILRKGRAVADLVLAVP